MSSLQAYELILVNVHRLLSANGIQVCMSNIISCLQQLINVHGYAGGYLNPLSTATVASSQHQCDMYGEKGS